MSEAKDTLVELTENQIDQVSGGSNTNPNGANHEDYYQVILTPNGNATRAGFGTYREPNGIK